MSRKPWETPITYNDDRWEEPKQAENLAAAAASGSDEGVDEDARSANDVEELLHRAPREGHDYECTDTTPIDYTKGPHDTEFGVDEKDFDPGAENPPVPYDNGPHDDEFGVDDESEDSLEPADNDLNYLDE